MVNYYKYLPVSPKDEAWGLTVLNTGCSRILPAMAYPLQTHPSHHYFNWKNGRVLQEYQVIYITKGGGLFESESVGIQPISAGTMIMLFPGERHRYKPNSETGWDEYWVGFKGNIADQLKLQEFLDPQKPFIVVGYHEKLLSLFLEIIEETRQELAGYQPIISGAVLHLLGYIQAASRKNSFEENDIQAIVQQAQLLFRSNIDQSMTPEAVALELGIGYSRFRKMFKAYTGLAPGQYQIQLRIQHAKELLLNPTKSVKEIAYELKFESSFYFCKLFKEKTGFTPLEYRKKAIGV